MKNRGPKVVIADTVTLPAVEFIRRFLLHVLPKSFVRIRHYGFLANRVRHEKLALCRALLCQAAVPGEPEFDAVSDVPPAHNDKESADVCPACQTGRMVVVEIIHAQPKHHLLAEVMLFDTS